MSADLYKDIAREVSRAYELREIHIGSLVGEQTFAKRLGISRAPVRKTFAILEDHGVLERKQGTGYILKSDAFASVPLLSPFNDPDSNGSLVTEIMRDRASGRIDQTVYENDLIARYGVPRGTIRNALQRLAADNLVMRHRGYGWQFVDSLDNESAVMESYAFRLEVECGALKQRKYRPDQSQLDHIRARHHVMLARSGTDFDREEWFSINADFHEALSAWSKNRFFLQAIKQQNNLRRMQQYADFGTFTEHDLRNSCVEHLGILDAIEDGDFAKAEVLLRQHLVGAYSQDDSR